MDALIHIKRLAIAGRVRFTEKADIERICDSLAVEDVLESILNANAIKKVIRSTSVGRIGRLARLYIIESPTYSGLWIYTKGTIRDVDGQEVFYVLISAKLVD